MLSNKNKSLQQTYTCNHIMNSKISLHSQNFYLTTHTNKRNIGYISKYYQKIYLLKIFCKFNI